MKIYLERYSGLSSAMVDDVFVLQCVVTTTQVRMSSTELSCQCNKRQLLGVICKCAVFAWRNALSHPFFTNLDEREKALARPSWEHLLQDNILFDKRFSQGQLFQDTPIHIPPTVPLHDDEGSDNHLYRLAEVGELDAMGTLVRKTAKKRCLQSLDALEAPWKRQREMTGTATTTTPSSSKPLS